MIPIVLAPITAPDGVAQFKEKPAPYAYGIGLAPVTPRGGPMTVTRAQGETVIGANGTVYTVGANVGAVGAHGLQQFQTSTNYCFQSQSFVTFNIGGDIATPPYWNVLNGWIALPVLAANAAVAPDGTTTAAQIDFPSVASSGKFSYLVASTTAPAGVTTLSFWARTVAGTGTLYVTLRDNDSTTQWPLACALTTTWQRFSVTSDDTMGTEVASLYFGVDTSTDPSQPTFQYALSCYLWGVQVENTSVATPYIVTTTATVARARDSITVPNALKTTLAPVATAPLGHAKNLEFTAGTNHCWASQTPVTSTSPNGPAWAEEHGGGCAATTMLANAALAPDGTMTATKFDFGAIADVINDYGLIYQGCPGWTTGEGGTGAPWTLSFWARTVSGTGNLHLLWADVDMGLTVYNVSEPLTTSWRRITMTRSLNTNHWTFMIGRDGFVDPAISVYVWGFQVEPVVTATPYIPTPGNAPVTRASGRLDTINTPMNLCYGIRATPGDSWHKANHMGHLLFWAGIGNYESSINAITLSYHADYFLFLSVTDGQGVNVTYYLYPSLSDENTTHNFMVYTDGLGHWDVYMDNAKLTKYVWSGAGTGILSANPTDVRLGNYYSTVTYYDDLYNLQGLNGYISKFVQGHTVREVAYELSKP